MHTTPNTSRRGQPATGGGIHVGTSCTGVVWIARARPGMPLERAFEVQCARFDRLQARARRKHTPLPWGHQDPDGQAPGLDQPTARRACAMVLRNERAAAALYLDPRDAREHWARSARRWAWEADTDPSPVLRVAAKFLARRCASRGA